MAGRLRTLVRSSMALTREHHQDHPTGPVFSLSSVLAVHPCLNPM